MVGCEGAVHGPVRGDHQHPHAAAAKFERHQQRALSPQLPHQLAVLLRRVVRQGGDLVRPAAAQDLAADRLVGLVAVADRPQPRVPRRRAQLELVAVEDQDRRPGRVDQLPPARGDQVEDGVEIGLAAQRLGDRRRRLQDVHDPLEPLAPLALTLNVTVVHGWGAHDPHLPLGRPCSSLPAMARLRYPRDPPAGVAQLVRAPACHAGGRRFESGRSRGHSVRLSPTQSSLERDWGGFASLPRRGSGHSVLLSPPVSRRVRGTNEEHSGGRS